MVFENIFINGVTILKLCTHKVSHKKRVIRIAIDFERVFNRIHLLQFEATALRFTLFDCPDYSLHLFGILFLDFELVSEIFEIF